MNLLESIVRSTIRFAPYKAGTYNVSTNPLASNSTYKPLVESAAWLSLGDRCTGLNFDPTGSAQIEVKTIVGGQEFLKDIIEGMSDLKLSFTSDSLSRIVLEATFGADITIDADFALGAKPVNRKGWINITAYNHLNAVVLSTDIWINLSLASALEFGDNLVQPKFTGRRLWSTLNSGQGKSAGGL